MTKKPLPSSTPERGYHKQGYKSVKDLARIFSLFNSYHTEEIGVNDIAKAIGVHPSKVSRMLGTIEPEGLFEKNRETGKYRLGIGFFELGMVYAFHFPLRKIMRPHIEHMAKELNLTASWAILHDARVIVVDRVQNLNIDLLAYRIGLNLPIHSTSVGKVLLAFCSEEKRERILQSVPLLGLTNLTIVDPTLVREHLAHVREQGYATDRGETHQELNCIAVPIRDESGDVIAAINLMDESWRTAADTLFEHVEYLKSRALFISRQLGYRTVF